MGDLLLAILLQLAGALVIIAEIFLPSAGILTAIALAFFGYSLYIVFTEISTFAGAIFIAGDVILLPLLILLSLKMIARSPATLKTSLSSISGVSSESPDLVKFLQMEGKALTNLRPSGIALIDGRRVDVTTRGELIEKDENIYVSKVTGNQIIVRRITDKAV